MRLTCGKTVAFEPRMGEKPDDRLRVRDSVLRLLPGPATDCTVAGAVALGALARAAAPLAFGHAPHPFARGQCYEKRPAAVNHMLHMSVPNIGWVACLLVR